MNNCNFSHVLDNLILKIAQMTFFPQHNLAAIVGPYCTTMKCNNSGFHYCHDNTEVLVCRHVVSVVSRHCLGLHRPDIFFARAKRGGKNTSCESPGCLPSQNLGRGFCSASQHLAG